MLNVEKLKAFFQKYKIWNKAKMPTSTTVNHQEQKYLLDCLDKTKK